MRMAKSVGAEAQRLPNEALQRTVRGAAPTAQASLSVLRINPGNLGSSAQPLSGRSSTEDGVVLENLPALRQG